MDHEPAIGVEFAPGAQLRPCTVVGVEEDYYKLMAKGAIIYVAMVIDSRTRRVRR